MRAPHGTPKEMLYLELGCLPFREKIRLRRLNFLHYILNEDDKSLIHKFFQAQLKKSNKKDWVSQIKKDLKDLEMDGQSFEDIKRIKTRWG